MKVIQRLKDDITQVVPDFQQKRALGYKAFSGVENQTNACFPIVMCSTLDKDVDYSTSISVAFAKSPMVQALEAYSLNQYCNGRFSLGIASQIKPHIVRRFNMPWTGAPATQMREYIRAMHAIWDSFENGGKLDFQGELYKFNLMTPEFIVENKGFGRPRLLLGAVGPAMTRVAGELTEGCITHSFVSEQSLRTVTYDNILTGLKRAGKKRSDFDLIVPLFINTGTNEEEYKESIAHHKYRIGFYASTPAYKLQLDEFGWGDLCDEARALTKQGRWSELGDLVTDEMLHTFTVTGEPHEIAPIIEKRFSDFVDTIRVELDMADQEMQYEMVKAIEAIPSKVPAEV